MHHPNDPQDVDPAKAANPLYETNQSQLSAPDDTVYADAGRGTGPASQPTSMMSTRSRQARVCRICICCICSRDSL